jgi:hypothetical protein
MLGGKSNSQTRPTALGTMLNVSSYGATIPNIYGTTRSTVLAIWAANLRKGSSSKKAKKKGVQTYVENVDFLIGSNPIDGCLRMWLNNTGVAPLNFINLVVSFPPSSGYTIVDPHFYSLIAVTIEFLMSGTFNDYGNPDGGSSFSEIQEYPLWNLNAHGPDLINAAGSRWWPFVYDWKPSYGNVVNFPQSISPATGVIIPGYGVSNGNVHFYYSQLTSKTNFQPPITYNRLAFESQLGSGSEYSNAGLSGQQIIYPHYAGLGSSDIDLGASAMLPDMRIEVRGSHALYPSGDADFADMIEDVTKSGQVQTESELGLIQRVVNCSDLPGPVQRATYNAGTQTPVITTKFSQAQRAGSYLICFSRWEYSVGGTTPAIADDAVDSWTPVLLDTDVGLWYAQSVGGAAGNKVRATFAGGGAGSFHGEQQIFELDPASDTLEDTDTATLTGTPSLPEVVTLSVTVSKPALLMLFIDTHNSGIRIFNVSPHWEDITPPGMQNMEGLYPFGSVWKRIVAGPGTYSVDVTFILPSGYRMALMAFTQSQASMLPKTLGNILDPVTMQQTRDQCRANGLIGSVVLDSQRKAADWLKEFYQCANAAPVWSGFKLKSIPYSEVSAVGNATVYIAPTASGPVATLTESDLIGDPSKPIITVERMAQVDTGNVRQIEHINRDNEYNVSTVSEPESGGIALYGPRKQAPITLHEIQDSAVARKILSIAVRRFVYLRNSYKFTMHARWIMLEAMDLILVNDSQLGIVNLPVRLTSVKETETFDLECEAEPFYYGVNAPNDLEVTTASPNNQDSGIVPAAVNLPIIFEPPLSMTFGAIELWFVVSDSDPNYGGCVVYVSLDGGNSFQPLGTIQGNATTGDVVSDWPAAANPDTTNDLLLDLTESKGALTSYSSTDEIAHTYPCYVGTLPYDPSGSPAYVGASTQVGPVLVWVFPAPCPQVALFYPAPPGGTDLQIQLLQVSPGALSQIYQNVIITQSPGAGIGSMIYGGKPGPLCAVTKTFALPPFPDTLYFHNENQLDAQDTPQVVVLGFSGAGVAREISVTGPVAAFGTATVSRGAASATLTFGSAGGTAAIIVVPSQVSGGKSLYVLVASGSTGIPAPWTARGTFGPWAWGDTPGTDTVIPVEPYELMTYAAANLTSANHYTLPATGAGNFLERAVFGVPLPQQGSDHAATTRWAFLDSWQVPAPAGILKVPLSFDWIDPPGGTPLFKFVQFNNLGGGLAQLADVATYAYQPVGTIPGGGGVGTGTGNSGAAQAGYQITSGGVLSNPSPIEIDMTAATVAFASGPSVKYNARVMSIVAPSVPTTYFVSIFDPTQGGDPPGGPNLVTNCVNDQSFVGVPGWVYMGQIVAQPAGSGTVTVPGGWPPLEQILVNGQ